jgi:predicted Zn-dependent peptidase
LVKKFSFATHIYVRIINAPFSSSMKKYQRTFILTFIAAWYSIALSVFAQKYKSQTFTEDGYTYEMVAGDPTQTRIYKLANGLTVYLSVYKDKPQIFTLIPVRAGSKNDPHDNTGLAHYLEHMVFKGTSKIGAKDYAKEKILLDSIERMFNRYRKLKDENQRKALYKKIDAVSLEASKLCYANEYDKLLSHLGGQGTNAFTSVEQTVYMNTIPSNQLEKWLETERERFSELVPRLFHTELEAVYEEKNMSLDDDNDKMSEALLSGLFRKHQYGTQTTIGTVEHLKNPSITEIKKFFNRYYVPNNMAICLAGEFDPAATIRLIDKTFGSMKPKPVPPFVPAKEAPILKPMVKKVIGPEEESVQIGFRFGGVGSREALLATMTDQILSNSQAGLMDLNLNQKQLVLGAGSYMDVNKDYSMQVLSGSPRQGQSLAEVRKLMLAQIDSIKSGKFEDWLIKAIVNNYKINQLRRYDSFQGRAFAQMTAFINGQNWADVWNFEEQMAAVTKQDIMDFAKKYYNENYVCVEKITGKDPRVIKISKPAITPVVLNKDDNSAFYKSLVSKPIQPVQPQFTDFKTDLSQSEWKPGINLLYKKNTSTPLFSLTYLVETGSNNEPKLDVAARLLDLAGAGNYSAEQFKKELFKLGSSISVFPGTDQTYITVTGLQENFDASVKLLEMLLAGPNAKDDDLKSLANNILKERANEKLDKRAILFSGLYNYARYGPVSPATNLVKNQDLPLLKVDELFSLTKKLTTYPHKILYFGPNEAETLAKDLERLHPVPAAATTLPAAKEFPELPTDSNKVFWIDYDMVQTELYFISRSVPYDPAIVPVATLFNEYMGGSMSSVVFQELRESKALAYSANGGYRLAGEAKKPNYVTSYIGCQADKLPEAMSSMLQILNDMPVVENSFKLGKEAIISTIRSERTTKSAILFAFLRAQKLGLDYDIRQKVYESMDNMSMEDLKNFQSKYVKDRKYTLVMIGKKDKINFEVLKKFGPVKELKVDDVFGH